MSLRIHAICLALNEECFVTEMLRSIYDVCSGISIISQLDRDWYGNLVSRDSTIDQVLSFPDKSGKIHLVGRRYRDEAAARNHEMLSLRLKPHRRIMSHGVEMAAINAFHSEPDYFFILDADEIYDATTIRNIIDYLDHRRPRGMRVSAYQYHWTWNRRIPLDVIHHHHFGFIRPGVLFKMRRRVTWNELRLQKLLNMLRLPDVSARVFGFIDCPQDVGMFHHGAYLGGPDRLEREFAKHSHIENTAPGYIQEISELPYETISSDDLPENIRCGCWPSEFWDSQAT